MNQPLVIKNGDRFGKLTVVRELPNDGRGRRFKLKCDCGKSATVRLGQLRYGKTKSCGCLFIASLNNTRTHGRSSDPIYYVWQGMRQRCGDPNSKSYPDYGGRGIKVCKRWQKFENFLADMGERPSPKHELDRIDNDKGYKPGNVRWIDDGVAQIRTRRKRKNTSSIYRGVDWWNEQGWRVRIMINGRMRYLGTFGNEKEAARAYDAEARRHKGYPLNFPP